MDLFIYVDLKEVKLLDWQKHIRNRLFKLREKGCLISAKNFIRAQLLYYHENMPSQR